ncbi:MAG: TldD/PmbA family protein, partial [Flavobacterium sp.]|nr:TldD/PmbA family protein [Flavobacterium sp.]
TIPRDGIFLIKNGEIVKSLKGLRISDNLQRILLNIVDISNKPEWIYWWGLETQIPVFTPYVLVKNVKITLPTM